jgi:hypothetical protein
MTEARRPLKRSHKLLKSLMSSTNCFVDKQATKQFLSRRNHFGLLAQNSGDAAWLSTEPTKTAPSADRTTGDSQMRITSFILAFAFVVAGSSMAGSAENGLPGIGTFSYNGSPVVASHSLVLAVR